jgi:hypothetical protein
MISQQVAFALAPHPGQAHNIESTANQANQQQRDGSVIIHKMILATTTNLQTISHHLPAAECSHETQQCQISLELF